jgi:hypothetical protein
LERRITPGFLSGGSFSVGLTPTAVAIADVNRDGVPDLITANSGSNTVSVLLGNSNGTFQGATNFATGNTPNSVALADVNGDGRLDVMTANGSSNAVSVLLGNGNGTFQAPQNFATGANPAAVAVADVNHDGRLDVIAVNDTSPGTVSVLLGNGNGTFQSAVNYAVGSYPGSVAVADVNGDGRPDLIVSNKGSNNVSVLLGNGDGTFQAAKNIAAGTHPRAVAVADMNGDGRPDIVTANYGSGSVSVFLGNGNGTFKKAKTFTTDSHPTSVAVADVNGDGRLDVMTANYNSDNDVSVLLGNGNGTFLAAQNFAGGTGPSAVAVADINGDGSVDLLIADKSGGAVSVLLNDCASPATGTFAAAKNFSTGNGPAAVAVADVNGDGRADIVTANGNDNTVSVLLGKGNGTFQAAQNFAVGNTPYSVAVADLNGDGKLDVVAANENNNTVSVLLGNGNGTFQAAQNFSTGSNPRAVAIADVNGDGVPDLITANYYSSGSSTVSVLLGNGNGTFQTAQNFSVPTGAEAVAVADLNGDGKPDLAVANEGGGKGGVVSVLLGNGDGTFQAAQNTSTGANGPTSIAVDDFNGDGKPDLVIAFFGTTPGTVSVFLGNGDGTFAAAQNFTTGNSSFRVLAADVNGDGRADIVTANGNDTSGTVSVLLGNGNGTFQAAKNYTVANTPKGVALGDVNGDGRLDVITANTSGNNVSILLGNRNAATHFQINGPLSTTTGSAFTITVTALTAGNQIDCNYTGTVKFTSSDPKAALPGNYTFTKADGGIHTFTVTLNTAGAQTLTVTDSAHSSTTGTVVVTVSSAGAAPPSGGGGSRRAAAGASGNADDGRPAVLAALLVNGSFSGTSGGPARFPGSANTSGRLTIPSADPGTGMLASGIQVNETASARAGSGLPTGKSRGARGLSLTDVEGFFAAESLWAGGGECAGPGGISVGRPALASGGGL